MRTVPEIPRTTLLLFLLGAILTAPQIVHAANGPAPATASDQVLFLNGDRLTGTMIEVTSDSVRFKTAAMGEVTIKWDTVNKITSSNRWVTIYSQKTPDRNSYSKFSSAELRKQKDAPVMILDSGPPVFLLATSSAEFGDNPPTPHELTTCLGPYPETPFTSQTTAWILDLNGSPSMINGTQSQQQLGGAMTVDVCENTKRNHSVFDVTGSHVRSWSAGKPSIVTDTFEASFTQQYFLRGPDGPLVFGIADTFFNTSLGMALQKSFGAGYNSRKFKSGPFKYSWGADVRYFNERLYATSSTLNLAGVRLQGDANYKNKNGRFSIDAKAWINPMFNDEHALQGFASLSPSFKLKPWVCIGLKEEDDYLGNAPVQQTQKLSFQLRLTQDSARQRLVQLNQ
jgi:hypothetical protein